MRRGWIEHLACPLTGAAYDLDVIRAAGEELVEGFLVSRDRREVRPLVAGIAVLPRDLPRHLRLQGNVYRRSPMNDPRLARFLLGRAGSGHDRVPFDRVVASYRDLVAEPPPDYDTSRPADDVAFARLVGQVAGAERAGRAALVGCGVGRGVFDLAACHEAALGLDRSVACVRRARNVAATREHFFLPAPRDSDRKELALDLGALVRDGADFAVADAGALPLQDAALDLLALADGDAQGPFERVEAAVAEARRALRPGGVLVWHRDLGVALEAEGEDGPWRAARPA